MEASGIKIVLPGQPELALFYYRDLNGDWSGPELETISGYNRS